MPGYVQYADQYEGSSAAGSVWGRERLFGARDSLSRSARFSRNFQASGVVSVCVGGRRGGGT